ncbi:MAG: hypothetical protein WCO08_01745 [Actinomycetes bacterium]
MIINCDTCIMRDIACSDCVISVLFAPSVTPAEITTTEERALLALAEHGMVPPLRFAQ